MADIKSITKLKPLGLFNALNKKYLTFDKR